jgi:sodium-dependent phosphate cotransporter
MMFFFMPGIVLALSFAGTITLIVVLAPIVIMMTIVVIVSILQRKMPTVLPVAMRTWKFLPIYMRSLEPLDRLISRCVCCKCNKGSEKNETPDGLSNLAYE